MREPSGFDALSRELHDRFAASPGARGLVLMGSAAQDARRDRWSDHDFFALVDDGPAARSRLDWLPRPDRALIVAREGDLGFAVLYDDGHLLEFALATVGELADAGIDEHHVLFGDEGVQEYVRARYAAPIGDDPDPANDVRLAYIKLLVGFGRARRGERIAGGQFVRMWAVKHLLLAVRGREASPHPAADPFDPSRRIERHHADFAQRLDAALANPVEGAARELAVLTRETLEPGWPEFPSAVADLVLRIIDDEWP